MDSGIASDDVDLFVTDFYLIDDDLDVGLAERNVTGRDVLAHHPAKLLDDGERDVRGRHDMRLGAIEGGLNAFAVDFAGGNTVAQDIIHFGNPVFDHDVDALQIGFYLRQFPLQTNHPIIDFSGLGSAPGRDGGEDFGQAYRGEKTIRQMLDDQFIERVHPDRAARAGALAGASGIRAGIVTMNRAVPRSSGT